MAACELLDGPYRITRSGRSIIARSVLSALNLVRYFSMAVNACTEAVWRHRLHREGRQRYQHDRVLEKENCPRRTTHRPPFRAFFPHVRRPAARCMVQAVSGMVAAAHQERREVEQVPRIDDRGAGERDRHRPRPRRRISSCRVSSGTRRRPAGRARRRLRAATSG